MKRFSEIYITLSLIFVLPLFLITVAGVVFDFDLAGVFIQHTVQAVSEYFLLLGKYINLISYNFISLLIVSIVYWRKGFSRTFSTFSLVVILVTIFSVYLTLEGV
jgi:hypothetical protein